MRSGDGSVSNVAKGRRLVQLARKILEAQGCWVEVAQNAVRWIPKKAPGTGLMPISVHHDFFSVWDLIAIWPDGTRHFYQVTTMPEVSHRRKKIAESGFPATGLDAILGYHGGRGRSFRVFYGPGFETWEETWKPVKESP